PRGLMRLLSGVEPRVETGEPERAANRQRECGDPPEPRSGLQRPQEQDQRGRRAESNIVAQGIELGTEFALRPKQPRDAPIEADDAEDGLSGDSALPQQHSRSDPGGKKDVHAAAEADQPNALPRNNDIAFTHEGNDPASDEAGDLREPDLQPVRAFDQQMLA